MMQQYVSDMQTMMLLLAKRYILLQIADEINMTGSCW